MAIQNQSSFIPKESLGLRPRRESTMGIFMIVSLFVLGISLLLLGGAYAYHYVLNQEVNRPCTGDGRACGLAATVENTRRELGVDEIIRYQRLDKKMKVAQSLIDGHTSMVPFFQTLENLTLHTVRFTRFDLEDGVVNMEGVARSYNDLAAQLKAFEASPDIRAAVFSDLGVDTAGNVTFDLKLTPMPSLLAFTASN